MLKKPEILPVRVLREAIKAVPPVKYALGIAGIGAAVAVVLSFGLSPRAAVWGIVVTLVLMTILVLFAKLSSMPSVAFRLPALVMTWFCLLVLIGSVGLMVTSVFFRWPLNLASVIESENTPSQSSNSEQQAQNLIKEGRSHIIALRGSYEGLRDAGPQLASKLLLEAPKAAKRLEIISDDSLDEGYILVKYGYSGLAYLLAGEIAPDPTEAGDYSKLAAAHLKHALELIHKIRERAGMGDAYYEDLNKWVDDEDIESWVRYDAAVAICRQAQIGGKVDLSEAVALLKSVPSVYLQNFPASHNPSLAWACSQNREFFTFCREDKL